MSFRSSRVILVHLACAFFLTLFSVPANAAELLPTPDSPTINLWKQFAVICTLPRLSGKEEPVRQYIRDLAEKKGLRWRQDSVGNLLISVPPTPGKKQLPVLILHSHLDMVGDKLAGSSHDFSRDPISCVRDGDWLTASGTTLGADNGIGVAAMLALLDEPDLSHGPLQLLFTVDEEGGFTGADGVDPAFLNAPRLLNLDSEESHEFNIGCAGGVTHRTVFSFETGPAPSGWVPLRLNISGLTGGHSGVEIHHGRANAIRLLARLLMALRGQSAYRIGSLKSGTFDTTIPREAEALVWVPALRFPKLIDQLNRQAAIFRHEYQLTDPDMIIGSRLSAEKSLNRMVWPVSISSGLPTFLLAIPAGVRVMSSEFPGLVETSANPGVLESEPGQLILSSHLQSSSLLAISHLGARIARLAKPLGGICTEIVPYTPWKPATGSPFVQHAVKIHHQLFSAPPRLKVVHAGLECGSFARINPQLDMLSFGPAITGAHTPGERVSIDRKSVV